MLRFHSSSLWLSTDRDKFIRNAAGGLPWWLSGKESARQCRRHMGSIPHIVEQPSPHALEPGNHNCRAHIWQLLKPACPRAHATQQEKLLQWEAHVPQLESSP